MMFLRGEISAALERQALTFCSPRSSEFRWLRDTNHGDGKADFPLPRRHVLKKVSKGEKRSWLGGLESMTDLFRVVFFMRWKDQALFRGSFVTLGEYPYLFCISISVTVIFCTRSFWAWTLCRVGHSMWCYKLQRLLTKFCLPSLLPVFMRADVSVPVMTHKMDMTLLLLLGSANHHPFGMHGVI